jgi:hypothetical protein
MPTVLPIYSRPPLRMAVGAAADVLGGDARQPGAVHRQDDGQDTVNAPLRTHTEMDEVVPVEQGQQEGRRHARIAEQMVGLALSVEVRHLVPAHEEESLT